MGCFTRMQQFHLSTERANQRLVACGTRAKEPLTKGSPLRDAMIVADTSSKPSGKKYWPPPCRLLTLRWECLSIAVSDATEPARRQSSGHWEAGQVTRRGATYAGGNWVALLRWISARCLTDTPSFISHCIPVINTGASFHMNARDVRGCQHRGEEGQQIVAR